MAELNTNDKAAPSIFVIRPAFIAFPRSVVIPVGVVVRVALETDPGVVAKARLNVEVEPCPPMPVNVAAGCMVPSAEYVRRLTVNTPELALPIAIEYCPSDA